MVTGSLQNEQVSSEVLSGLDQKSLSSTQIRIPSRMWVPILMIGLLLVALYYRIAIKLVVDWYNIPDYSMVFWSLCSLSSALGPPQEDCRRHPSGKAGLVFP